MPTLGRRRELRGVQHAVVTTVCLPCLAAGVTTARLPPRMQTRRQLNGLLQWGLIERRLWQPYDVHTTTNQRR